VPENFNIETFPYDPDKVTGWEAIHDQELIQNYVQKRNLIHFGQAQGTPFTTKPLHRLKWQANSTEAREIIKGVIPLDFITDNPNVNRILRYMIAQISQKLTLTLRKNRSLRDFADGENQRPHRHQDVTWDYDKLHQFPAKNQC
jgi:hypothetical protein